MTPDACISDTFEYVCCFPDVDHDSHDSRKHLVPVQEWISKFTISCSSHIYENSLPLLRSHNIISLLLCFLTCISRVLDVYVQLKLPIYCI